MKFSCDMCGKKSARVRRMTRTFGRGAQAFLIENVPTIVSSSCGESYWTAETLHELDRLRAHRKSLGSYRRLLVVRFGGAA